MSLADIIREMGGGLSAIVIAGLAWIGWTLWRDSVQQREGRMSDLREANLRHETLARELSRALDALSEALRDERRE